jgi:benzoate-CoA ligase
VTFSVARLFFSYGLVNSLYLPLLAGASAVLLPGRPDPASVLDVMRRHRPTLFFSVPTSYAALCAALEGGESVERPFDSLRLAISAGEPLPAPVYERWLKLTGVELLDGIGSTEVGYIFCSNLPGRVQPGSSGVMLGDHEARIVGEHGRSVNPGEAGELLVRAASTALHYWNQRDRSKTTFVGEWLRTGDRYFRDAQGYYWYLGRINDIFKVSGQWVSPMEVESSLLEHEAVLECAVVGELDSNGLMKTKAFVVRREGAQVTEADLQLHVKQRLHPHKYPRWIVFLDQLPKTATGKVQRYKLRSPES